MRKVGLRLAGTLTTIETFACSECFLTVHAALPSRSSKSSDRPKYSCLAKPPDQELGMAPGDANRISQYRFSLIPRAAMP